VPSADLDGGIETQLWHHFNTEISTYRSWSLVSDIRLETLREENGWFYHARLTLSGFECDFTAWGYNFILDAEETESHFSKSLERANLPILVLGDISQGNNSQIHGIVIRRNPTCHITKVFERVGYFWIQGSDPTTRYLKLLESQSKMDIVLV
jgi:hypothetical protein